MTLAMAGARRDAGVSVAEVNLKFIWEVVSQIKVGNKGQAFVIDGRGRLIAHPDISLVLRNTDMFRLDYVKTAARRRPGPSRARRRDRQRRAGPRGADRARADPAAALADVRRAADRRGLCAALRIDQAIGLAAGRRPGARLPRRPAARAQDDHPDPAVARRRGADRRRQSRAAHLDQDRRRARSAGRPVQRHGRTAGGILRRPGKQGRAAHRRARAIGERAARARRGLAGGQLDARSRTGADHHHAARSAAFAHRRRRDLRVRRGAAGVQACAPPTA